MTDNRIFLIHQPSGLGVLLLKRSGGEVYTPHIPMFNFSVEIEERSESLEELDDMVIMNEETNYGKPWEYTAEQKIKGLTQFKRS